MLPENIENDIFPSRRLCYSFEFQLLFDSPISFSSILCATEFLLQRISHFETMPALASCAETFRVFMLHGETTHHGIQRIH
jgi:hypothetical protein